MDETTIKTYQLKPGAIQIEWGDGHTSKFHFIWLKDNAPSNRHPNGQKLGDISQIPPDISPASIVVDHSLRIEWTQDGQIDEFDPAWLRQNAYEPEEVGKRRRLPILWDAERIRSVVTEFDFPKIAAGGTALRDMLRCVRDYGFAVIHEVPAEPEGLFNVVDLFGYVRETNYGRLFDVRVTPNPTNLAFTGLTLIGHTDNPYRHPVPTLQLLHFLKNRAEGGDSTLVDGFRVAEDLRRRRPQAFELLAGTPVSFRFQSEDAVLSCESTIIERDVWGRANGIRFNNRSMQPFYCPPEQMEAFYEAYCTFGNMLEDPTYKITFKLSSGDLMLFDNQRILHGRIGYQAGGERHLQGCYADKDSLLSRLAVLEREGSGG
jgi:gamma-butyrobetaine hydroxylase